MSELEDWVRSPPTLTPEPQIVELDIPHSAAERAKPCETMALIATWERDAILHQAECDVFSEDGDEAALHKEAARVYRKCAASLRQLVDKPA